MDSLENSMITFVSGLGADDGDQKVVRQCLEERGVQNITIEVDSSQSNHAA